MAEETKPSASLAPQTVDYVASAVRAVAGAAPFVGSLLVEISGHVIPNQRVERIARFAALLESRLSSVEQSIVRAKSRMRTSLTSWRMHYGRQLGR